MLRNFIQNVTNTKWTSFFKMLTAFSCIIFLNIWTMVSNFKFIPYFNILQNFVQNVRIIIREDTPNRPLYVLFAAVN